MMASEDAHVRRKREEKNARGRSKKKFWRENDRSDHSCPECGRSDEQVEQWEVHHEDGDPMNTDLDNLRALCRDCHYRIHDRTPPRTLDEWKAEFEAFAEGEAAEYERR